ncbi:MAG: hypothetical protein ACOZCL_00100 [Bacillota bacterium]
MIAIHEMIKSGILLAITIGMGILLSIKGKPYNGIVFTLHKLTALGAAVFAFLYFRTIIKSFDGKAILYITIIAFILSILALFISGALLSLGKAPYHIIRVVHIIGTILSIGSVSAFMYYLLSKK